MRQPEMERPGAPASVTGPDISNTHEDFTRSPPLVQGGSWLPHSALDRPFEARIEPLLGTTLFDWAGGSLAAARQADHGLLASILPLRTPDGEVADFVAWSPEHEARWRTHNDTVPWLGWDFAEHASWLGERSVSLSASPAEWLRRSNTGLAFVGPYLSPYELELLERFEFVLVGSPSLAKRLEKAIWRARQARFQICVVPQDTRAGAAQ